MTRNAALLAPSRIVAQTSHSGQHEAHGLEARDGIVKPVKSSVVMPSKMTVPVSCASSLVRAAGAGDEAPERPGLGAVHRNAGC
jgi:hypothetical protein